MTSSADPAFVADEAGKIFAKLEIPYLIGGSLASTLHAEPRGTLDVDVAADLSPVKAVALAKALEGDFFVDAASVVEAAVEKRVFNAIHEQSFVKLVVHVRVPLGHFAEEHRRARTIEFAPGRTARFATAEDTLLRKLWWYRRGDHVSDHRWRDALGILRTSGARLDLEYMARWAIELDVADLVERAWREARHDPR